ncbi:50S ribosomal protein L10 [Caprobacter fermentans]|uniref:Large ribosomal subunit protein uL10 n=1 Tax=Caproicibacter fermentans TaxID=2576756 RepID=A0A6N8HZJ8_9FIRM|nr:50S ribosomal protein L10 [Caproicibacter fermentans]MVB11294.1 50S ribosomal protein L10 [Caproicibacter fermentans]OCN00151.1 50S ribosomal protein L10 [Clostridium sp. W14A]
MPSEKILEGKKQAVSQLSESLKAAHTGVIVNYKGITVEADTKLRRELREAGCQYKVVKNTLLRLALQESGISGLDGVLEGTTAIAVHSEDYVAPAKILAGYADKSDTFKIKAGFIDGKVATADEIKTLASLPSKEELVAQALRGLNAPITGLVTVLNGTIKGLVVALNAIAEKQQASA